MKLLVTLIFFAFQTIVHSTAYAWSPIQEFRSTVESMQYCYWTTASSDDSQAGENKEQAEGEEEPDCD
ncbi:MAG: hypothetical protein OES20_15745 [Gammaproteobacteria bacterium]|nr:hypothetical protein [Gammaproteobacteria bacterium]MDH3859259.1 hypothetical protein [Gammaproteobacteria bacterium]